jgi:hypothetical protein
MASGGPFSTMHLHLDLSKHCVETEIKRCYNLALSRIFKPHPDKEKLEETIRLTREALEGLDFQLLRSGHAGLRGGTAAAVMLTRDRGGRPRIVLDGRMI